MMPSTATSLMHGEETLMGGPAVDGDVAGSATETSVSSAPFPSRKLEHQAGAPELTIEISHDQAISAPKKPIERVIDDSSGTINEEALKQLLRQARLSSTVSSIFDRLHKGQWSNELIESASEQAVDLIVEFGQPGLERILQRIQEGAHKEFRWSVAAMLGFLRDRQTEKRRIDFLKGLLQSDSPGDRIAGVTGLGRLDIPEAWRALEVLLNQENNPLVTAAAQAALRSREGHGSVPSAA